MAQIGLVSEKYKKPAPFQAKCGFLNCQKKVVSDFRFNSSTEEDYSPLTNVPNAKITNPTSKTTNCQPENTVRLVKIQVKTTAMIARMTEIHHVVFLGALSCIVTPSLRFG